MSHVTCLDVLGCFVDLGMSHGNHIHFFKVCAEVCIHVYGSHLQFVV